LPVADDRVTSEGQEGILGHVVEVAEREQDRRDRTVFVLGLVAGEEEAESFLDRAVSLLLDRHQVEVVAQLAAAGDLVQLHREQVAESRDLQAAEAFGWSEAAFRPVQARLEELEAVWP
jgi:sugar diacid utilization regulator